jgi:hypothetical protein
MPIDGLRIIGVMDDHDPRFIDPADVLLLVFAPVSATVLLGTPTSTNLQASVAHLLYHLLHLLFAY